MRHPLSLVQRRGGHSPFLAFFHLRGATTPTPNLLRAHCEVKEDSDKIALLLYLMYV